MPALLMTRLPGRPPARAAGRRRDFLRQLAEALVEIHDTRGDLRRHVRPWQAYYPVAGLRPPVASGRPALWEQAIEVLATPPPVARSTFLHRDYHPGNTLWEAGRLSGIVDWESASWGPPGVDLGHLRANLAIDQGRDAADLASELYRAAGGDVADQAWWDLRALLDFAPSLGSEPSSGEDLGRLERYLDRVLQRT